MPRHPATTACPSEGELERYFAGLGGFVPQTAGDSSERPAAIAVHVQTCGPCQAWLGKARADEELLDVLRAGVAAGAIEPNRPPSGSSAAAAGAEGVSEPPAAMVPGYRIVRKLAEGGMGVVYEAEQQSPRRTVALKVIRSAVLSAETVRRFEHEAHILGMLEHPGIATVFEAGTGEGVQGTIRFFAMEFVRGRRLTTHAAEAHLGTRQRLELMARICDAVQHAHQKGVIHRDLKPSNILVDASGQPKVLDFGVARLTDCDLQATTIMTDVGQLVGTLPYMSPEQAAGDSRALDTRSDVYSLGVVLYELLCGQLPYPITRTALARAAQIIREQPPVRPSTIDRALRGDVETIALKALEKERERRYQSAAELAADIRRYLSDEPITARAPTLMYKVRKLVVRHRAVAALLTTLLAALVTATFLVSLLYLRSEQNRAQAEAAERQARARAETATRVSGSLMELFGALDPLGSGQAEIVLGASPAPEEILDRAAATIFHQLDKEPETQIELLLPLARVNLNRARYGPAEELARRALEIAREHFGDEHAQVAHCMRQLASVLTGQHKLAAAEPLLRESVAMHRRILGPDHPEVGAGLCHWGNWASAGGDYPAAERMLREALRICQTSGPTGEVSEGGLLLRLGNVIANRGATAEAEEFLQQAIAAFQKASDDRETDVNDTLVRLASVRRGAGDLGGAEELLREVLAQRRERYGERHPRVGLTLLELGATLRLRGDVDTAEAILRDALAMQRDLFGAGHPVTLGTMSALASLLSDRGSYAAAEELARSQLEVARQLWPPHSLPVIGSVDTLGAVLLRQGRLDEAETLLKEALESRRQTLGADLGSINALENLAAVYSKKKDFAEAERCLTEALQIARARVGGRSVQTSSPLRSRALLRVKMGRYAEAEADRRAELEILVTIRGADSPQVTEVRKALATLLLHRGQAAAAAELYAECLRAQRARLGAEDHNTQVTLSHLIRALQTAGDLAAAEPYLDEMFAFQQERLRAGTVDFGDLYNLIRRLHAQNDGARAAALEEPAAELYRQKRGLPESNSDRVGAGLALGALRMGQGDWSAAEALLREAAVLRAGQLGPDHWLTAYLESLLGECLVHLQRCAEAEPLLVNALDTLREDTDEVNERTREVLFRVIELHDACGQPERAAEYRALVVPPAEE